MTLEPFTRLSVDGILRRELATMVSRKLRTAGAVSTFRDIFKEIVKLVRTEAQLLRTELAEKAMRVGLGIALTVAAAILFIAAIILLFVATIATLVDYGFSLSVATLIVAGAMLAVGAIFLWLGLHQLRAKNLVPSKTIEQVQKDVEAIKTEVGA